MDELIKRIELEEILIDFQLEQIRERKRVIEEQLYEETESSSEEETESESSVGNPFYSEDSDNEFWFESSSESEYQFKTYSL